MAGREDYYERLEYKKELYNKRMEQSEERSKEYSKARTKITDNIPMGQPILVDHYSGRKHQNDLKRANNYIKKSIEEDKKTEYYQDKIDNIEKAENGDIIYDDDPLVLEKLNAKLNKLEEERKEIKARPHAPYELVNIGTTIRGIKERIENIKFLEQYSEEVKDYKRFTTVVNKDKNRVQVKFKDRVAKDIYIYMRSQGFVYSRMECAFQRKFNKQGITKLHWVAEDLKDRKVLLEKEEGNEM